MENCFLSVIIPVYNVEKYLPRCIESILNALDDDSEIVLVTGGSTDLSDKMCEQYAQTIPCIRHIVQNGKGLSDARNCGVGKCTGEWLVYVDSDDYVDSNLFRNAIALIRSKGGNFDVSVTDFIRVTADGHLVDEVFQIGPEFEQAEGAEFLHHLLRKKQCFWNVWRYFYRRSFIYDNGISFLENSLSEDMDYTARVYAAHPRFLFSHCPYYRYCIGRGGSLMDNPTLRRLTDTITNILTGISLMEENELSYSGDFIAQYQFEYILNLALCREVDPKERKQARKLYRQTCGVLRTGNYCIAHIFGAVLSLLPVVFCAEAMHIVKLIRRSSRGMLVIGDIKEKS